MPFTNDVAVVGRTLHTETGDSKAISFSAWVSFRSTEWHALADPYYTPIVTVLPKVIWEQAASPSFVTDSFIAAAHNRSAVFAMWRQCARSSNTRFLDPTTLTIPKLEHNRFSRFCTADAAFSLYVTLRHHISPKIFAPFRRGICSPN